MISGPAIQDSTVAVEPEGDGFDLNLVKNSSSAVVQQ